MLCAISPLIGSTNKPAVHRDRQVAVGRQPKRATKTSSKSSLLTPLVDPAQSGLSVPREARRTLTVRRREAYEALEAARQREQTEEFAQVYAQRAGIEGTHAQGVRRMGLRRSRSIGEPRTHVLATWDIRSKIRG